MPLLCIKGEGGRTHKQTLKGSFTSSPLVVLASMFCGSFLTCTSSDCRAWSGPQFLCNFTSGTGGLRNHSASTASWTESRTLGLLDVYGSAGLVREAIPGGQSADMLIQSDVAGGAWLFYVLTCCFRDFATSWCPDNEWCSWGKVFSCIVWSVVANPHRHQYCTANFSHPPKAPITIGGPTGRGV